MNALLRSLLPLAFFVPTLSPSLPAQELVDAWTADSEDTAVGTRHAVSGDRAVMLLDTPEGQRLRLFEQTATGWEFDQEWDPGVQGIRRLDLDGDVLVLGATAFPATQILIYERQPGGTWNLEASFADTGVLVNKIVVSETTVAVGIEATALGIVRIYRKGLSGWDLFDEIFSGPDLFLFGSHMDLEGPWLAVGRPDQEQGGGGGGKAGQIRIYRDQGSSYELEDLISGGGGLGYRQLDLDGDRLLTLDFDAQIWRYDGNDWVLEAELPVPVNAFFGGDVALRGRTAIIGAPEDGDGALYTFSREGNVWSPAGRLVDESGLSDDDFGYTMDVSGATLLVAGREGSLAAQVFDLPIGTYPYGVCGGAFAPCGNPDPFAGCSNSTGSGATLRAQGSVSLAADDLLLTLRSLPAQQFGLLYMGGATAAAPFGDGLRVVGSGAAGLVRFQPQPADSMGTLVQGPGLAAQSGAQGRQILAGDTWYFQGWYRDSQGGPCGTNFNLSNGLRARFQP